MVSRSGAPVRRSGFIDRPTLIKRSVHCPKVNPKFLDITWNVVGKRDTTRNASYSILFSRYISCYISEFLDYLWDSVLIWLIIWGNRFCITWMVIIQNIAGNQLLWFLIISFMGSSWIWKSYLFVCDIPGNWEQYL